MKKYNKLRFHIKRFTKSIIFYIKTIIYKKDDNIWIFGSWLGKSYSDNSKYIYEYIIKNEKTIKAYWITKSVDIYNKLTSENKPVLLYPSKEAMNVIKRAKYSFQTEGNQDICDYKIGGTKTIQLYHGIPAKNFNWFKKYSKLEEFIINIEWNNHKKSLWVSPSEYYDNFFSNVYKVNKKNFVHFGLPRCDSAYILNKNEHIKEYRKKYDKIGIYLPTHRNFGKDFNNSFILEGLHQLDEFLNKTNYLLLYKPHPNEIELFNICDTTFKNIKVLTNNDNWSIDLYNYIYDLDFLVSDYSSVIYDYLVVNKPIILFVYDIEWYKQNDAGLTNEFFTHQVGPMVKEWKMLFYEIVKQLKNDEWMDIRIKEKMFFNTYSQGKSCKDIVEYLKNNKL